MSKYTAYKCDICKKEKEYSQLIEIKARSDKFVTYANWDEWFADRAKFHICEDCVNNFKLWLETKGWK